MLIIVSFMFNHEEEPTAVTGIEGDVHDILLPCVGDIVEHKDAQGEPFRGKVTERIFAYAIPTGLGVNGSVTVIVCMDRTAVS